MSETLNIAEISTCFIHSVLNCFYLFWIRNFKVISNKKAKEINLKWYRNVFGDEINHLNCRSIWIDRKGRRYRVKYLEGMS